MAKSEADERATALNLAVLHHGLACLADGAVPAGAPKVTQTAEQFLEWLRGEAPTDQRSRRVIT